MKKNRIISAAAILMAGCLGVPAFAESTDGEGGQKMQIVTTIFPEYDWIKNRLGDNPAGAQITMLLDNGVDLHSYQPTAEDIMKISTCDLFVYTGGESDAWVDDALQEAVNEDMVVIDLLDALGDAAKEEEIVEGMEEHEHEHDHEEDGDDDAEHAHEEDGDDDAEHAHEEEEDHEHAHEHDGTEYDEHVWLSLKNAALFVDEITAALGRIDPDHAAVYRENADAYCQRLRELDLAYEEAVEGAQKKTLLFGDRFPFRYLTDDYGLTYYAAFAGCSAETEASFETILFLAQKADELGLDCVMTIEGSDQRIAQTIVQSTKSADQKILVLDSMQSVTAKDVLEGAAYLPIMEKNLQVLREALG